MVIRAERVSAFGPAGLAAFASGEGAKVVWSTSLQLASARQVANIHIALMPTSVPVLHSLAASRRAGKMCRSHASMPRMIAQTNQLIDGRRLWDSLMTMARIGATAKGGVRRLTLTEVDRRGRDR